jgi:hypothetical protein
MNARTMDGIDLSDIAHSPCWAGHALPWQPRFCHADLAAATAKRVPARSRGGAEAPPYRL